MFKLKWGSFPSADGFSSSYVGFLECYDVSWEFNKHFGFSFNVCLAEQKLLMISRGALWSRDTIVVGLGWPDGTVNGGSRVRVCSLIGCCRSGGGDDLMGKECAPVGKASRVPITGVCGWCHFWEIPRRNVSCCQIQNCQWIIDGHKHRCTILTIDCCFPNWESCCILCNGHGLKTGLFVVFAAVSQVTITIRCYW